jgi:hypothetical protein
MKIAILYAGRIESYDEYYSNLKKYILKENDVDFFLYHNKILNEDLSGFIELYKPKIVIDEYINEDLPIVPAHYNGMSMFYSRYYLFKKFKDYCSENIIHYDAVMVYRLDLLALHDICFEHLTYDDNTIYLPNLRHSQGLNDFMAIGNMNSIEKYCHLAQDYTNLLIATNNTGSNEFILKTYLQSIQINIQFFNFRCLLRDDIWENGGGGTSCRDPLLRKSLFV